MKRFVTFFLAFILAIGTFAGCGSDPEPTEPTKKPGPQYNYPKIADSVTWDKINAFPVKTEDMTTDEMRQLCVDFFNFSKTALWTPNATMNYTLNAKGSPDEITLGRVYGGLPYIGLASGNIYRLMDYIDEETGVVDMTEPSAHPELFGNQCSIGAYWGWGRVINSADFSWTFTMIHSKGFLRVGPYTYDDTIIRYSNGLSDTATIIQQNGEQTMFQSYAAMKLADGLVSYLDAGHVMMCSGEPVVVYNDDGTINGLSSYVTITDQFSTWAEGTNEQGDTYAYKNYVNKQFTFLELLNESYIPFTFAEFLGTDPVEATECTFSHSGDTITPSQLRAGEVTANYGISDSYAIIRDKDGNTVFTCAKRAEAAGITTTNFYKTLPADAFDDYATGEYTVEVVVQLATGERLSLYSGTLVK